MSTYNFKDIEPKWQKEWADKKSFAAPTPTPEKPAYFMLVMFPYPSGNLHMGHVRNYTIGDVLARFHRRRNRSVLHPIGWDSFGLPAENAAIKHKTDPSSWTWKNIAVMRDQLKMLAISYDWDREIATCHPDYYHWNQWLFIKMLEKGLAYRKNAPVNWCNSCMTVLANEQVHNGHCWRCDSLVVQKDLTQWFYKITAYADELLSGHEQLKPSYVKTSEGKPPVALAKGWPEQVLAMQSNWIGKSTGAYADFLICHPERSEGSSSFQKQEVLRSAQDDSIRVFTTRPDTLAGATFLVLAPEHPLVQKLTTSEQRAAVDAYRTQAKGLSKITRTAENREKTGVFTGGYAENPLTGAKVPVWVADYVLTDYGTGAIMAVPAHDQRDFDFAKQFKLPVIQVVQRPEDSSPRHASGRGPGLQQEEPGSRPKDRRDDESLDRADETLDRAYEADGILINSGIYNGLPVEAAQKKMAADLEAKKKGGPTVTFKLRDWLLSRQRYWGTPIPIVYCPDCGPVPVKLSDLPVVLPTDVTFTGEGASPLAQAEDWINTPCPTCGKPARRETDTMDTFVDSSWYYARYTDPKNTKVPFDPAKANTWIPVHQYVGGSEHANMHLIYSRFIHKVLRDMGMVKSDEPFSSLLTQGMVTLGGSAMSKSKGNVVDPNDVINRYGADTCRLFILFAAPPTQQLEWSDKQIEGIWRFLNRVWRAAQAFIDPEEAKLLKRTGNESADMISADELTRRENVAIQRVTHDIDEDFGFNTAISALMELTNAIYLYPNIGDAVSRSAVETVIQLLAPFAPHITEELWMQLGHKEPLSERLWPTVDAAKLAQGRIELVIQVNGKVKERISVPSSANEQTVTAEALAALQKKGVALAPKRVIYVPQKLVNFVG